MTQGEIDVLRADLGMPPSPQRARRLQHYGSLLHADHAPAASTSTRTSADVGGVTGAHGLSDWQQPSGREGEGEQDDESESESESEGVIVRGAGWGALVGQFGDGDSDEDEDEHSDEDGVPQLLAGRRHGGQGYGGRASQLLDSLDLADGFGGLARPPLVHPPPPPREAPLAPRRSLLRTKTEHVFELPPLRAPRQTSGQGSERQSARASAQWCGPVGWLLPLLLAGRWRVLGWK